MGSNTIVSNSMTGSTRPSEKMQMPSPVPSHSPAISGRRTESASAYKLMDSPATKAVSASNWCPRSSRPPHPSSISAATQPFEGPYNSFAVSEMNRKVNAMYTPAASRAPSCRGNSQENSVPVNAAVR